MADWDDKRDPPLDHRMLDQRWISGRFLVDCSDSDLFLHAWHAKFFDVNYKLNVKNTFQLKFNSRNRQLNALCTPRSLLLGFLPQSIKTILENQCLHEFVLRLIDLYIIMVPTYLSSVMGWVHHHMSQEYRVNAFVIQLFITLT